MEQKENEIGMWLSSNPKAESALNQAGLVGTLRSKRWDFPSNDLVRFVGAVADSVGEIYCSVMTVQVPNMPLSLKAFSVSSGKPLVPEGSWPYIPSDAIEIVRGAYTSDDSAGKAFDELLLGCVLIWSGSTHSSNHFDNYNLKEKRV